MQFKFFFSEAVNSLFKNWVMSVAAIVTVLVSMFLLGIVMILYFNVEDVIKDLRDKLEIEVFIKNTATQDEINQLGEEIQAMPEVKTVYFVSKEEALDRMRESLGENTDILDAMSGNPLPASYEIALKDPEDIRMVAERFFDNPIVDNTPGSDPPDGVKYGAETSERVLRFTTMLLIGLTSFVALLTVASVLLISNTIRLSIFARRREIEIMRLVGATNWFIRWPYVLEGIFTGVMGATVAAVLIILSNNMFSNYIRENIVWLAVQDIPILWMTVIVIGGGAIVGALGSGMALRRFLKV
ncbi:MAG: ABC transporter permease [Gaiellales bacterium]|nr:MAG: ABC transporter permease [Gaiellales bacterium]